MKINFGTIALNAEDFIKQSIESVYGIANKIIIIEGAVGSGATGKCLVCDKNGLSTDKTEEIIRSIKDPYNKIIYERVGWVETKKDLSNRYLEYCDKEECDYIWQLDSDEVYDEFTLKGVRDYLEENRDVDLIEFLGFNFIGDINHVGTFGHWDLPYRRVFRFIKGCRWDSHIPPKMNYEIKKKLSRDFSSSKGWHLYHYSWVTEKQVDEKLKYYANKNLYRPGWKNRVWKNIFDTSVVNKYGTHPYDENFYHFIKKGRIERFIRRHPKSMMTHELFKSNKNGLRIIHPIHTWNAGGGCKCPYLISKSMNERYGDSHEFIYSCDGVAKEELACTVAVRNPNPFFASEYINKKGFDIINVEWWNQNLGVFRDIRENTRLPMIATIHIFPIGGAWSANKEDLEWYDGFAADNANIFEQEPFVSFNVPKVVVNSPGDTDRLLKLEKIDHSGINVLISCSYNDGKFRKNTFDLMESLLGKYKDVCIYFAGVMADNGEYHKRVLELSKKHKNAVYTGFINTAEFFPYTDIALNILSDISYAASESFLQEAMTVRIPTIKLGGLGSTNLTPGNIGGFIADGEDSFLEHFDELYKNRKLREEVGEKAREIIIDKYLVEHSVECLRSLYLEILDAKK